MKFLNAIIIPLVFTSGCGNGGSNNAMKESSESGDNQGALEESWVVVNGANPAKSRKSGSSHGSIDTEPSFREASPPPSSGSR